MIDIEDELTGPVITAGLVTPLGPLSISAQGGYIVASDWVEAPPPQDPLLREAVAQVAAYFDKRLQHFHLPLRPLLGFPAYLRAALEMIPYGETRTYGELGRDLGVPARGVGQGCGANPVPVIVPCHRVLGTRSLGGYSGRGGVETKVALLKHEGAGGFLL